MNERLHQIWLRANELAREAAKKKNKVNNPQQHTIYNEFVGIYAELIIKECGEAAAFGDPQYSAQHNIHKHFGIE